MKYYTENEYKQKLAKAKRHSKQMEMRGKISEAENAWKEYKPKMETSKKLAIYLFVLMNVVIIYCLVAMWYFSDLSYLGVIITDIASQILIYGIYCLKAYKAKKSSEDMAYKRERLQGIGEVIEAGAESSESVPVRGDISEFNYSNRI